MKTLHRTLLPTLLLLGVLVGSVVVLLFAVGESDGYYQRPAAWACIGGTAFVLTCAATFVLDVGIGIAAGTRSWWWLLGAVLVMPLSAETAFLGQDYARSLDGAQRPHGTATIPAGDVADALIRALVLLEEADDAMLAHGGRAGTVALATKLRADHAALVVSLRALSAGSPPPTGHFVATQPMGVAEVRRREAAGTAYDVAYADHMVEAHLLLLQELGVAHEENRDDAAMSAVFAAAHDPLMDALAASRQGLLDPDAPPR